MERPGEIAARAAAGARRWARGRRVDALVLAGYAAVSVGAFGWRLLPHPGRYLIGAPGERDPEIFVWSFAWWPHAIGALVNPFAPHVVYAPTGVNLAWLTSVPALALPFAPLTVLAGPDVSYNVAALLLPALAAWTAYLLCHRLTRSLWAAIVGGYLFGFSGYVLGHELGGHLNLIGVFLLPLIARALVLYVSGELGGRGLAWRLGAMVALELGISTEVALTATLVLVLGLALAAALLPRTRRRVLASAAPIAAGYGFAGLLASPLLYYALRSYGGGSYAQPWFFDGDLLNLVLPTREIAAGGPWLQHLTSRFPGNLNEQSLYLGAPLLAIVLAVAARARRSPPARFLIAALVLALLLALGTSLHVDGQSVVTLPWSWVTRQPLLNNVLPARFAVYVALAAAVAAAAWIASSRGRIARLPIVLPLLAVAALVPVFWRSDFVEQPERWPFFTDGLYRICFPPGETLGVFPFGRWGDSLLWQAESGFYFSIAEGNLGRSDAFPPRFVRDRVVAELDFRFTNPKIRPTMAQLVAYAARHRVDRIVSAVVHTYPDGTMMHAFGPEQALGGVLVAPACGYTTLTGTTTPKALAGQQLFGPRAAYTVVLDSARELARSGDELAAHPGTAPAAARTAASLAPVLAQLHIDDFADPSLGRAADLLGREQAALPERPRRAAALARETAAALRAYARTIDSGIASP